MVHNVDYQLHLSTVCSAVHKTVPFCLEPKAKILPVAVFHKLLAACIAKWPLASSTVSDQKLIFSGMAVFSIDKIQGHQLTLLLVNYVVHAIVTTDGKRKKLNKILCGSVRTFLLNMMMKIIREVFGVTFDVRKRIKCPHSAIDEIGLYFDEDYLMSKATVTCEDHDPKHPPLMCRELLTCWHIGLDAETDTYVGDMDPVMPSKTGQDQLEETTVAGPKSKSALIDPTSYKSISFLIEKSGKNSEQTRSLLKTVCLNIAEEVGNAEDIWTGYVLEDTEKPVFVVETREDQTATSYIAQSVFDLRFRQHHVVSKEAEDITKMEKEKNLQFSLEETNKIKTVLSKHGKSLLDNHKNIQILSASKVKSKGYGTDNASIEINTCIVIYVPIKGIIPFGEEPFPSLLDDLSVDIREGYYEPYPLGAQAEPQGDIDAGIYHEQLMMGCKISRADGRAGTLGAFVVLGHGDKIGCLTCCHVALNDTLASRVRETIDFNVFFDGFECPIYQPDVKNQANTFGRVKKALHRDGDGQATGIDAALIEITDQKRNPEAGVYPNATATETGFSVWTPMKYETGWVMESIPDELRHSSVFKYGCMTGHTKGSIKLDGIFVQGGYLTDKINGKSFTLCKQIEIENHGQRRFGYFGDSGALILLSKDGTNANMQALALLVGGTSYHTVIATPIWEVLDALGLPRQLYCFQAESKEKPVDISARMSKLEGTVKTINHKVSGLNKTVCGVKKDVLKMDGNVKELMKKSNDEMKETIESTITASIAQAFQSFQLPIRTQIQGLPTEQGSHTISRSDINRQRTLPVPSQSATPDESIDHAQNEPNNNSDDSDNAAL